MKPLESQRVIKTLDLNPYFAPAYLAASIEQASSRDYTERFIIKG